jgi:hypothetical protein
VDDITYFSTSDKVEWPLEERLSEIGTADFMGQVSIFLVTEFSWKHENGHVSVTLTQQSFREIIIDSLGITSSGISTFTSPYRSGHSIDSIPYVTMSSTKRDELWLHYQSLVDSLNWLAHHTTRPDISASVSLLAQHQINPSPGHLDAAFCVARI